MQTSRPFSRSVALEFTGTTELGWEPKSFLLNWRVLSCSRSITLTFSECGEWYRRNVGISCFWLRFGCCLARCGRDQFQSLLCCLTFSFAVIEWCKLVAMALNGFLLFRIIGRWFDLSAKRQPSRLYRNEIMNICKKIAHKFGLVFSVASVILSRILWLTRTTVNNMWCKFNWTILNYRSKTTAQRKRPAGIIQIHVMLLT